MRRRLLTVKLYQTLCRKSWSDTYFEVRRHLSVFTGLTSVTEVALWEGINKPPPSSSARSVAQLPARCRVKANISIHRILAISMNITEIILGQLTDLHEKWNKSLCTSGIFIFNFVAPAALIWRPCELLKWEWQSLRVGFWNFLCHRFSRNELHLRGKNICQMYYNNMATVRILT
jgi:hypothetical protein